MRPVKIAIRLVVIVLSLSLLTEFGWPKDKRSPADERRDVLEMRAEVLEMLYQEAPGAKSRVQESVGYAVNYEIELTPGVKLYQITENGLALQATLQGTRYVVDDRLN